ncbi:MAG: tetratricopeptide repeat protein, partial [Verrucomicrobia bacterium]|nr:tetratricopeptide repeat protein [Verrucomicrobiota bacterium]
MNASNLRLGLPLAALIGVLCTVTADRLVAAAPVQSPGTPGQAGSPAVPSPPPATPGPSDDINAVLERARALTQAARFAEAQSVLEAALRRFSDPAAQVQLWPAAANLQITWGLDLKHKGNFEEAIQHCLAAFAIDKAYRPQSAGPDLNYIGVIYNLVGVYDQAIRFYTQALEWDRKTGNRWAEGATLDNVGQTYYNLGQFGNAIGCFNQALTIRRELQDRRGESVTLGGLGNVYQSVGQFERAVECYRQALVASEAAGDRGQQGVVLVSLGGAYSMLGDYGKAVDHLQRGLALARETKNRQAEAAALNGLGSVYHASGRYDAAAEMYRSALAIDRETKNRPGENAILNNLGSLAMDLGRFDEAVKDYESALKIARELGDRSGEADTLGNLGVVYVSLEQLDRAVPILEQGLKLAREIGSRETESCILNTLSGVYRQLGQRGKALEAQQRAMTIAQESGDLANESLAIDNLGSLYLENRNFAKALAYHKRALALARAIGNPRVEAGALASLMTDYRLVNKPRLAILYGKLSIAAWEKIRGSIRALEAASRKSFIESQASIYRELAELLIGQGRLSEGQQVLGLLKEQEYIEYVPRGPLEQTAPAAPALAQDEAGWAQRYRQEGGRVEASAARRQALRSKTSRTPAETQELKRLDNEAELAMAAFERTLDELDKEAAQTPRTGEKVSELRESEGLMQDLRDLGTGVVAVCTLAGETKLSIILITPDAMLAREAPIGRDALKEKIASFRRGLQEPDSDPLPAAQELYQILIGPIEKDLQEAKATTLMWSLDGALRYLPVAALHDGHEYLVQRYRSVEFTLASRTRLKEAPAAAWNALGLGVSKAEPGFPALPAVPKELHGIIRDEQGMAGVLPGTVLLDEAFTADRLQDSLHAKYAVVHIASHFELAPGDDSASFLLLGDGSHLTLARLALIPNLFADVDLLTLSACNTAMGGTHPDGRELESLGMIAQRKGAKAVVATLWPVADESTRLLMQEFYRLHAAEPGISKAE